MIVTCAYVQLPQHGFQGCFSTQRKLCSPVDLKAVPYFVDIQSEERVYRAFLFVPGRPAVCFDCGLTGHMKNACPGKQSSRTIFTRPLSPVSIPDAKKRATHDSQGSEDSST